MSNENLNEKMIRTKPLDTKSDTSFKINEKDELKEFLSNSFNNDKQRDISLVAHDNIKLSIKDFNQKAKKMNLKIADLMNVNQLTKKPDISQTLSFITKGN